MKTKKRGTVIGDLRRVQVKRERVDSSDKMDEDESRASSEPDGVKTEDMEVPCNAEA